MIASLFVTVRKKKKLSFHSFDWQAITNPRKGTYGETLDTKHYPFVHSGFKLTAGDLQRGAAEGHVYLNGSLEDTLRYLAIGLCQCFCAIKRTLHQCQVNTVSSNLAMYTSEQNGSMLKRLLRLAMESRATTQKQSSSSAAAPFEKSDWEPKVECKDKVNVSYISHY